MRKMKKIGFTHRKIVDLGELLKMAKAVSIEPTTMEEIQRSVWHTHHPYTYTNTLKTSTPRACHVLFMQEVYATSVQLMRN